MTQIPADSTQHLGGTPCPPVTSPYKWGLFGVLVLATVLRLHGLAADGLWYDEAQSLTMARFADLEGSLMDPRNMSEAPAMAVLTRAWLAVVGAVAEADPTTPANDFLIRLMPCLFSLLTVALVFYTGRAVTKENGAALAAAFLCAISPFQVYYAQELRIYSAYTALSLVLVYCLVRALEEDRARFWGGLAAAKALLLYFHFVGIWTLLFVNLFFLVCLARYRPRFGKWAVTQAVAGLLALPAALLMLRAFGYVQAIDIPWYGYDLTWKTAFITFKAFVAGYGATVWAYWPLFILCGGLFALGLGALWWRRGAMAVLVLLLAAGPIVINILMWKDREFSFYHHRMFLFSGTVAFVAMGAGLHVLRRYWLTVPAITACALFTVPLLHDHYTGNLHPIEAHRIATYTRGDYRAAARFIREQWREGDVVTAASHFTIPSLRHYLGRDPYHVTVFDWAGDVLRRSHGSEMLLYRQGLMPQRIEPLATTAGRVWFVESTGVTFEYPPHTRPVREWLEEHLARTRREAFTGLYVTLYTHEAAVSGESAP